MSIVLAHQPDFAIGPVTVVPSHRELVGADGTRHVLEPRVMQVLVALARADGAVVSKDDLLASCWEGRVVGEDAINRVMSRLRRAAEDEAHGAFRIETVTRVGYRLCLSEDLPEGHRPAATAAPAKGISRRTTLAVLAVAALASVGGGAFLLIDRRTNEARTLEEQARAALDYGTSEQVAVSIAKLRRLTVVEPDRAANWSLLACAYVQQAWQSADYDALMSRAGEARRRALAIDPDDPDAAMIGLLSRRPYLRWSAWETDAKALRARFPDHVRLRKAQAAFLNHVGRGTEALRLFDGLPEAERRGPGDSFLHVLMLREAGRLDAADTVIERAFVEFPQHFSVWFTRMRYLTYTGRSGAALAMITPGAVRPPAIPDWNFALAESETRAFQTRDPEIVARTIELYKSAVEIGTGFQQNAIIFNAAMGLLDAAFAMAQRFFFDASPGAQRRYAPEQGVYATPRSRPTFFLFSQETASMRGDPRFMDLSRALRLEDYWRSSGIAPDYRGAPAA